MGLYILGLYIGIMEKKMETTLIEYIDIYIYISIGVI